MTKTIDGPNQITYKGYQLEVMVKYRGGLYAGDSGYKFVRAVVDPEDRSATGECGANVFPLRLATWLACRRAVKDAESGPQQSRFERVLNRLDGAE